MPRLHPHIRNVTDVEPIALKPDHIVEPNAGGEEDVDRRRRKQMRIEKIAEQYIRLGRVPLILSAELRGPFGSSWKNPWVHAPCKELKDAARPVVVEKKATRTSGQATTSRARARETIENRTKPDSSVPSPEASRGASVIQESALPEPGNTKQIQASQPENPGATDFFSVDPEPSLILNASHSNPFWLRRPSLVSVGFSNSISGYTEPSPTRGQQGNALVDENGRLLLSSPKQPLQDPQDNPNLNVNVGGEWKSSASASMVITSPTKPTNIIQHKAHGESSAKRKWSCRGTPRPAINMAKSGSALAKAADSDRSSCKSIRRRTFMGFPSPSNKTPTAMVHSEVPIVPSFTPVNGPPQVGGTGVSYAAEAPAESENAGNIDPDRTASDEGGATSDGQKASAYSGSVPEDHQTPGSSNKAESPMAENTHARLNNNQASKCASGKKRFRKDTVAALRHNHVASPTFASSAGFTYRKVGQSKRTIPSPAEDQQPEESTHIAADQTQPQLETDMAHEGVSVPSNHDIENDSESAPAADLQRPKSPQGSRTPRPDVYAVPGSPHGPQESYKSSRTSGFSTQAALLLAQMDFQQETMPTMAEDTPHTWTQPHHSDTPREDLGVPSPAFTPFHEFNAALEEECAPDTAMRDLPISTQDLFAAASPFAFSTVKKSTRPQASNLRFSVFASGEQGINDSSQNGAKSPTPSERVPLKDKNRVNLRRSQSEKGSQESMSRLSKSPIKAVELPKLDFGTPLDEMRSNGDLEFTDRFLLNLKDLT